MVQRFDETVNLQPVNTNTGAIDTTVRLADRLNNFQQRQNRMIDQKLVERGIEQSGQLAQAQEGVPDAPAEAGAVSAFFNPVEAQAFNQAQIAAYKSGVENDVREQLNIIATQNPNDIGAFNDQANAYLNATLESVDPAQRAELGIKANDLLSKYRQSVQTNTINFQRQQAQQDIQNAQATFTRDALRFAREGDVLESAEAAESAFGSINDLVETNLITEAEGARMREGLARDLAEESFLGQVESAADRSIGAGFDKLKELSEESPQGFTPDEWNNVINRGKAILAEKEFFNAEQDMQRQREIDLAISDLTIGSRTGAIPVDQIIKDANSFFDAGYINGDKRASLISTAINNTKQKMQTLIDYSAIDQRRAGDDSLVMDSNTVDQYYIDVFQPEVQDLPPEMQEAKAVEFVERIKLVPEGMKNKIVSDLYSDNPDLIANAANLMDQLDEIPGIVDEQFSANQRALATTVASLSQNLSPQEAVKLARQNTDPNDKARVEARNEQIRTEKFSLKYGEIVDDEFNGFFSSPVDPLNQSKLESQYKSLFEQHYIAGMDEKSARDKALQLIKRNWGTSTVSGQDRAMMYPPEQYYSVGTDNTWMTEELYNDVRDSFLFDFDIEEGNVILFSDDKTAREASTGNPSYQIKVISPDGLINVLEGYRWRPDRQQKIDDVQDENEKRVQQLRQDDFSIFGFDL